MGIFVFVDNSNVWIEGKYFSEVKKGIAKDFAEAHSKKMLDNSWKIDFGKLLKCVVKGQVQDVKKAIVVGSKPTNKDSLWRAMETAGFEVETFKRNGSNKEKRIDTGIAQKISKVLYKESEEKDLFVLVLGDRDYSPVVEAIKEEGRNVRIAFWSNAAGELIMEADENLVLDEYFDEISYSD